MKRILGKKIEKGNWTKKDKIRHQRKIIKEWEIRRKKMHRKSKK